MIEIVIINGVSLIVSSNVMIKQRFTTHISNLHVRTIHKPNDILTCSHLLICELIKRIKECEQKNKRKDKQLINFTKLPCPIILTSFSNTALSLLSDYNIYDDIIITEIIKGDMDYLTTNSYEILPRKRIHIFNIKNTISEDNWISSNESIESIWTSDTSDSDFDLF